MGRTRNMRGRYNNGLQLSSLEVLGLTYLTNTSETECICLVFVCFVKMGCDTNF